ncbi:DUF6745 domain-containing protein [Allocoleopsis sp.]|uniref:DUF6745 domain-containing protein n=1 Tax=Allocoleopsis sp. TaxID=3088169 RepID=UPI0039C8A26B
MSPTKITQLTPEQEAMIAVYREKWQAIALSTEPIDHQKATEAVKAAYVALGQKEPDILFFDSPSQAITTIILHRLEQPWWRQIGSIVWADLKPSLWSLVWNRLWKQLSHQLSNQLSHQLEQHIWRNLWSDVWNQVASLLRNLVLQEAQRQVLNQKSIYIDEELKVLLNTCIQPELWACYGSRFDFCRSMLNCACDRQKWSAFESLVTNCGWIFPNDRICYVCDRPTKLSFDSENRLHAEGEPALEFADGYSLYSFHGVRLPKKYGKLHPNQWQAEWVLEEDNSELRRVLIQGIGYGRICQELEAQLLDSWQDYSLLKIDNIIDWRDGEPIYLLKMTCPSTGFIHAMRVPPDTSSAREAIAWVNWGIDPEEFQTQT